MTSPIQDLWDWLNQIHHLSTVYHLLYWDQDVTMPPGGASGRGDQLATLERLKHERLTSDTTARLIEAAKREVDLTDMESDDAALVRVAERDFAYASQLPTDFVAEFAKRTAVARDAWRRAKEGNDFSLFAPHLQAIMDAKLRESELRGYDGHPYDAMLGAWERGLTTEQVTAIFDAHRQDLIDLRAAVDANADAVDDSILHQPFDVEDQRQFAMNMCHAIGIDFANWATFHSAPHPFCLQISKTDIRITTRYNRDFFNPAFFGAMHESGHGLHGHGIAERLDGTFLSDMELYSHALAESQSRTWENLVGRSRAFWEWAFPFLDDAFPSQFTGATPEQVYRAVNKSGAQFIRVEADELTYNLHIMLRFEIEKQWVEGKLRVADLPDAWNATFERYFGITPPDVAQGVLQDVHWSVGGIGAFVGYALGNLLASQFYAVALRDYPDLPDRIARGDFHTLRGWLTDKIYQHGRKYTADEIARRVTGEAITPRPYVDYLTAKFADLYGL